MSRDGKSRKCHDLRDLPDDFSIKNLGITEYEWKQDGKEGTTTMIKLESKIGNKTYPGAPTFLIKNVKVKHPYGPVKGYPNKLSMAIELNENDETLKKGLEKIDAEIFATVKELQEDIFGQEFELEQVLKSKIRHLANYHRKKNKKKPGETYDPTLNLKVKKPKDKGVGLVVVKIEENLSRTFHPPESLVYGTTGDMICELTPIWKASNDCGAGLTVLRFKVNEFGGSSQELLFDDEQDEFGLEVNSSTSVDVKAPTFGNANNDSARLSPTTRKTMTLSTQKVIEEQPQVEAGRKKGGKRKAVS